LIKAHVLCCFGNFSFLVVALLFSRLAWVTFFGVSLNLAESSIIFHWTHPKKNILSYSMHPMDYLNNCSISLKHSKHFLKYVSLDLCANKPKIVLMSMSPWNNLSILFLRFLESIVHCVVFFFSCLTNYYDVIAVALFF